MDSDRIDQDEKTKERRKEKSTGEEADRHNMKREPPARDGGGKGEKER